MCTATAALGIQFAVELSSCMQAKVTLKSDLFASLRLQRDVKVPQPADLYHPARARPPRPPPSAAARPASGAANAADALAR